MAMNCILSFEAYTHMKRKKKNFFEIWGGISKFNMLPQISYHHPSHVIVISLPIGNTLCLT